MEFIDCDLFGGLTGVGIDIDEFGFREGISLRKTSAYFLVPFLMCSHSARTGQLETGFYEGVNGGYGFDIEAELFLPKEFSRTKWFNRLNTIWLFTALLRLKCSYLISVPVISDQPFDIKLRTKNSHSYPMEAHQNKLVVEPNPKTVLDRETLEWVKTYWEISGNLMTRHENFNLAFQALDQCIWNMSISLAMVSLWGAIELLFSPSPYELKYRISTGIASFLEPPGDKRIQCFKKSQKLYDLRSKAAHGSKIDNIIPLQETYSLLREIVIKIIEDNHVPTKDDLEKKLMGDEFA